MSFSNVPVGYLFQNLGKLYGVSFSISAAAASKVVSVEITDVEFDKALEIIAASAGVTVTESGKGVYIVRAFGEDTEGVSQEEKKRKEQEKRLQGAVMESVTTKFVGAKEVQEALKEIFDEILNRWCQFLSWLEMMKGNKLQLSCHICFQPRNS